MSIATDFPMESFTEIRGLPTHVEPMGGGLYRVTAITNRDVCPHCFHEAPGYGQARTERIYKGAMRTFHQGCWDEYQDFMDKQEAIARHRVVARRARRLSRVMRAVRWVFSW